MIYFPISAGRVYNDIGKYSGCPNFLQPFSTETPTGKQTHPFVEMKAGAESGKPNHKETTFEIKGFEKTVWQVLFETYLNMHDENRIATSTNPLQKMKHLLFAWFLILSLYAFGQTSKEEVLENIEKTAGVYFAYPAKEIKPASAIPQGFEAFYISHLGRHGSRYLISDHEYKDLIDLLGDAHQKNALTELGTNTLHRLHLLWKEVELRGGDLSNVGIAEQRGIAERMYASYPKVFTPNSKLSACATTVVRCVLSMDFFCERLKELQPALVIPRFSGNKWQWFLNHHTSEAIAFRSANDTWKPGYHQFEKDHVHPERLIQSLFTKTVFSKALPTPESIMWALYAVAGGMQNIETKTSFYDLFTKEELFDLWQCKNYKLYVNDANAAISNGIMMENAKPLLRNLIDSTEKILKTGQSGADFRFLHDGNIIPMAMLMHLEGCYNSEKDPALFYKVWSDFKVAPMASNIQLVFYRNTHSKEVLVKILLNENEIRVPPVKPFSGSFYRWTDLQAFYQTLLQ